MWLKTFIKNNKWRMLLTVIYILGIWAIANVILGEASWYWLLVSLVLSKFIQIIGHSIGMHRYFSHRSFETTRLGQDIMAWTSLLLGTGSPIQYARNHRFHHQVVDTENDIHSPHNDGKFMTAVGIWAFHDVNWFLAKGTESVRDLMNHPTFRFINKWYYVIWSVLIIFTAMIDLKILLYVLILPSFIFHLELNIFVNVIGHVWGYRNYETPDHSKNNHWVQAWTLGEGLHNNHHAEPHLYSFARERNEFDASAWVIEKFFKI